MARKTNKKTNPIIIIVSAVIVLTMAVFFIYYLRGAGGNKKSGNESSQKETIVKKTEPLEQLARIIKTKNLDSCNQIMDDEQEKICVNNVALALAQEKLDVSYCQKLDGASVSIADCEKRIILSKAIKEEKADACNSAPEDHRRQCRISFYHQLAIKKDNAMACDGLDSIDLVNSCKDNFEVMKNFYRDPSGFNCGVLKMETYKADCSRVKSMLNSPEIITEESSGNCTEIKTAAFFEFCKMRSW